MAGRPGRSGRKPTPTNLKLLKGNPGKRKLDTAGEVQPMLGAPECPDWLSDEAKAEWARVCPELEQLGVLAFIDRAALAAWCVEWARFVEAEENIREHGIVLLKIDQVIERAGEPTIIVTKAGRNPATLISTQAQAHMRAWASEFGFTPSARTRVRKPGEGDGDGAGENPERLLS